MNFWTAAVVLIAATVVVFVALSINGATEQAGHDDHGHDDHGHGHGGHH